MSFFKLTISFAIIVLTALSSQALGNSFLVTTKSELETAVDMALPGDSIIVKDQVWAGISMVFNCNGTAEQPITICPETPGGASLESGSRIEIGGDYLLISGFKISNGSHSDNAIRFYSGDDYAYHTRLSSCWIDGWGPVGQDIKIHWVVMKGGHNRVDHCRFSNMNHVGVTLLIKSGTDQVGHHLIDHNYFGPKSDVGGNGGETIKVGGGDDSMYPLYSLVEKNFFYRCDGEVELISNKSWENIYRYNTFYESQGTLTLRWGKKCRVEGNYFIGNGRSDTGGIRLTDDDHVIINNYLENLTGTNARAAISVMSGIGDAEGGDGGHGQTRNARILHNTIINCKESMNIGYWDDDDLNDPRGELLPPENCTIANNIVFSSSATLLTEQWEPSINTTWLSNIGFGAPLGMDIDTGWVDIDPKLEISPEGIMKLTQGSPAVDSGTYTQDTVWNDFEMQARDDGKPDIGADELSDASKESLPIGQDDVGPDWYTPHPVGVESTQKKFIRAESLKIYPNPARERFYISMDESFYGKTLDIEIFDTFGRKVYTEKISNLTANPELVLAGLEGLYIVRISCDNKVYQSKVLLNK